MAKALVSFNASIYSVPASFGDVHVDKIFESVIDCSKHMRSSSFHE